MIPNKIAELSDILNDKLTYNDIASIQSADGVPIFSTYNLPAIVQRHKNEIFKQEPITMEGRRGGIRQLRTVTLTEMIEYCLLERHTFTTKNKLTFIEELMSWNVPIINKYIEDRRLKYDALRERVARRDELLPQSEDYITFENLPSRFVYTSGIITNSGLPQEQWLPFYKQLQKFVVEGKISGNTFGEKTPLPNYRLDLSELLPILKIDHKKVAFKLYKLYYGG